MQGIDVNKTSVLNLPFKYFMTDDVSLTSQAPNPIYDVSNLLSEYQLCKLKRYTVSFKDILFSVTRDSAGSTTFKQEPIIQFRRVANDHRVHLNRLNFRNKVSGKDNNNILLDPATWGDYKTVENGSAAFHFELENQRWTTVPRNPNAAIGALTNVSFPEQPKWIVTATGTTEISPKLDPMELGDYLYPQFDRGQLNNDTTTDPPYYSGLIPFDTPVDNMTAEATSVKNNFASRFTGAEPTNYHDYEFQIRIRNLPDTQTLADVTYTITYQIEVSAEFECSNRVGNINLQVETPKRVLTGVVKENLPAKKLCK